MTTKLRLNTPIHDVSAIITELEFQPPKAKHIRNMPSDDKQMVSYMLDLAGELSGTTPRVINELSADDTFRVLDVINSFFQSSQGILKKQ